MKPTQNEVPTDAAVENPFVGPQTFTTKQYDLFFGRDPEARKLLSLVAAKRFVIFYAESGAGKSSLINARLIPQLRNKRGFQVLPVGRVSGTIPPGVNPENVFAFNLMNHLDSSALDPSVFSQMRLVDFLQGGNGDGDNFRYHDPGQVEVKPAEDQQAVTGDTIPTGTDSSESGESNQSVDSLGDEGQNDHVSGDDDWFWDDGPEDMPRALIIDQFEELFTHHIEEWEKRADFFDQLRAAMEADPDLVIVLALREDYLAKLSPYARRVPGAMRSRYYMQRMNPAAALLAIQKPAAKRGRPFAKDAAEELLRRLLAIDSGSATAGKKPDDPVYQEFIEPLQLQVVCQQLWESVEHKPLGPITSTDLAVAGNVDQALADFYDGALGDALKSFDDMSERRLRQWVEDELITGAGTRGTVYLDEEEAVAAGMPLDVVKLLEGDRLLRRELRARGAWVELIHDGFVRPIRQANRRWQLGQSSLIRSAESYDRADSETVGRSYLYKGGQLEQARVEYDRGRPDPLVAAFLTASQQEVDRLAEKEKIRRKALKEAEETAATERKRADDERQRAEQQARSARVMRYLAWSLAIILFAILLSVFAIGEYIESHAAELLQTAQKKIEDNEADSAHLSTLLALEARRWDPELGNEQLSRIVEASMHPKSRVFVEGAHGDSAVRAVWSPDGAIIASHAISDASGSITMWDVDTGAELRSIAIAEIAGADRVVKNIALNRDGSKTAVAFDSGEVEMWGYDSESSKDRLLNPGETIVRASDVAVMAWNPISDTLAIAWQDGTVELRDADRLEQDASLNPDTIEGFAQDSMGLAWNPDGDILAFSSENGGVSLWAVNENRVPVRLERVDDTQRGEGDTGVILDLAWAPDGRVVASGAENDTIVLWDVTNRRASPQFPQPPAGQGGDVLDLEWSHDGRALISISSSGLVHFWTADGSPVPPAERLLQSDDMFLRDIDLATVALGPGALAFIVGREDGKILLGHTTREEQRRVIPIDTATGITLTSNIAWSPDSQMLAAGASDGNIMLWGAGNDDLPSLSAPAPQLIQHVAWNPVSGELLAVTDVGDVLLWDVGSEDREAYQIIFDHARDGREGASVASIAWRNDGGMLTLGFTDGALGHYAFNDGALAPAGVDGTISEENQHWPGISALAWNPVAPIFASVSDEGKIELWNTNANAQPVELEPKYTDDVNIIAWHPRGQILLVGSRYGDMELWRIQFSEQQDQTPLTFIDDERNVNRSQPEVINLTWNPDGRRFVTGNKDGTATLWYADESGISGLGEKSRKLAHMSLAPSSVIWSPDGRTLAVIADKNSAKLWPRFYVQEPCSWIQENLTVGQWLEYQDWWMAYEPTCPGLPAPDVPKLTALFAWDAGLHPFANIGNFGTNSTLSQHGLTTAISLALLLFSSIVLALRAIWVTSRPSRLLRSPLRLTRKPFTWTLYLITSILWALFVYIGDQVWLSSTIANEARNLVIVGLLGAAANAVIIGRLIYRRQPDHRWLHRPRLFWLMAAWLIGVAMIWYISETFLFDTGILAAIASAGIGLAVVRWLNRSIEDQSPIPLTAREFVWVLCGITVVIWVLCASISDHLGRNSVDMDRVRLMVMVGAIGAIVNGLLVGTLLHRHQPDHRWLRLPWSLWRMVAWVVGVSAIWFAAGDVLDDRGAYAAMMSAIVGLLVIWRLGHSVVGHSHFQAGYGVTAILWTVFLFIGVGVWGSSMVENEARNAMIVGALGALINGLLVGRMLHRRYQIDHRWLHGRRSLALMAGWIVGVAITWMLCELLFDGMGIFVAALVSAIAGFAIIWWFGRDEPVTPPADQASTAYTLSESTWALIGIGALYWGLFAYFGRELTEPVELMIFGAIGAALSGVTIGYMIRKEHANHQSISPAFAAILVVAWIVIIATIWAISAFLISDNPATAASLFTIVAGWLFIWRLSKDKIIIPAEQDRVTN